MLNEGELILYHGSYCKVCEPDFARCAGYKDFGRGFYLTTSREQAERFSRTSLRKAVINGLADERQNYGVVSIFGCSMAEYEELKICTFETADINWLHCVTGHRKGRAFQAIADQYCKYDVISGKIANDATNATITAYMAGAYGAVGSDRAAEFCISLLLPERLKDQYCFRTGRAPECLYFMESVKIWK